MTEETTAVTESPAKAPKADPKPKKAPAKTDPNKGKKDVGVSDARKLDILKAVKKSNATGMTTAVTLKKLYDKLPGHVPGAVRREVRVLVEEGKLKKVPVEEAGISVYLTAKGSSSIK